jgi:hypothetical protein
VQIVFQTRDDCAIGPKEREHVPHTQTAGKSRPQRVRLDKSKTHLMGNHLADVVYRPSRRLLRSNHTALDGVNWRGRVMGKSGTKQERALVQCARLSPVAVHDGIFCFPRPWVVTKRQEFGTSLGLGGAARITCCPTTFAGKSRRFSLFFKFQCAGSFLLGLRLLCFPLHLEQASELSSFPLQWLSQRNPKTKNQHPYVVHDFKVLNAHVAIPTSSAVSGGAAGSRGRYQSKQTF